MKRYAIGLGVVIAALLATPAHGSDRVIPWTGNGSENLPCSDGGHWVLAPAFGIESAILVVNEVDYVMTQSGEGSWSADSQGEITAETVAYVAFTGDGDERDHLQLSHCLDTSSTPPPTSPPPTSSSPPPTSSSTPPATPSKPSRSFSSQGTRVKAVSGSIQPTAFTGGDATLPAITGIGLLLAGTVLTVVMRRRSA